MKNRAEDFVISKGLKLNGEPPTKQNVIDWLCEFANDEKKIKQTNSWVSVDDDLPIIEESYSRINLPIYVVLDNGLITIADYTRSKFIDGDEYVASYYAPIWICRERGVDISNTKVNVKYWQRLPKLN